MRLLSKIGVATAACAVMLFDAGYGATPLR